MREESAEIKHPLRTGFTTGACATAISLAAANLLLTGKSLESIEIVLPRGQTVNFVLTECHQISSQRASAATIKDAGDDPDATHGATVFCEVELADKPGVRFHAAEGVGTVTRAGLIVPVGQAAINPVPRQMMTEHLTLLAKQIGYNGGFEVHVGIRDGERIALNTMNGRLGIIGGLSILGTTGIVKPFSCAAFIASIHNSIDVAHANGLSHIAAATGSTSESYIQNRLNLPDMAIVEMGDFAGAVLKHLRKVPMAKLSICGGFGKISKLAAANSSLHSKDSSIDFPFLSKVAERCGADAQTLESILESNTSLQVLSTCQSKNIPLGDAICNLARDHALKSNQNKSEIDVYAIDKSGYLVGSAI